MSLALWKKKYLAYNATLLPARKGTYEKNVLEWRMKYRQSSIFEERENSLQAEEPSDINRTERFLIYHIAYKNSFEANYQCERGSYELSDFMRVNSEEINSISLYLNADHLKQSNKIFSLCNKELPSFKRSIRCTLK